MNNFSNNLFVALVALFFSARIQCCDQIGINSCLLQYSLPIVGGNYNCDEAGFDNCLSGAAYDSCTAGTKELIDPSINGLRLIFDSPLCTGDESPSCLGIINTCKTQLIQFMGTGYGSGDYNVCLCEKKDTWLKRFDSCISKSSYDECESPDKATGDVVISEFREQFRSDIVQTICNNLYQEFRATCACATKVQECIKLYLGNEFWKNIRSEDFQVSYPQCLQYGTQSQYKNAADCFLELPGSCGLDLDEFTGYRVPERIPFGYNLLQLRYGCLEGCQDEDDVGDHSFECYDNLGGDSDLPLDEIKALTGQRKIDLCKKVEVASECGGKRLSVCPSLLFGVIDIVNQIKLGQKDITTVSDPKGARVVTLVNACDINLRDYTEFGKGSAGSINPLQTITTLTFATAVFIATRL